MDGVVHMVARKVSSPPAIQKKLINKLPFIGRNSSYTLAQKSIKQYNVHQ
jgi:hypothetical protein